MKFKFSVLSSSTSLPQGQSQWTIIALKTKVIGEPYFMYKKIRKEASVG